MEPYYADDGVTLYHGDALATLRGMPDASVDCCVTSPPYFGLRDYGSDGQYGLEESPAEYVEAMRAVFAEVRRVLADDGTLWVNLGDSYGRDYGLDKSLLGIPWEVAFALRSDGWFLRNSIIWHKPNAMPSPATDRFGSKHEVVFLLSKSKRYWFDLDAVREPTTGAGSLLTWAERKERGEPLRYGRNGQSASARGGFADHPNGRNPGDVWTVPTVPFSEAHFAVMPPVLASKCIESGCRPGGVVLDPFSGSGTTGLAAGLAGRRYVGIDVSSDYLDLSLRTRLAQATLIHE